MADYRRFYSPGLEHRLHLEDLERSALQSKVKPVGSGQKIQAMRRWLALVLANLAERIDPHVGAHDAKPKGAV